MWRITSRGVGSSANVTYGAFRLEMPDGQPLPLEGTDGVLVSATMQVLHDATAAAGDGTGRWIEQFPTRVPDGSEATDRWEGSFSMVGDTVHIAWCEGASRLTWVFGADGVLTTTNLDTGRILTCVRL